MSSIYSRSRATEWHKDDDSMTQVSKLLGADRRTNRIGVGAFLVLSLVTFCLLAVSIASLSASHVVVDGATSDMEDVKTATTPLRGADDNSFVMMSIGGPRTLDPALNYDDAGGEVLQNVYETLVFYNENSAEDLVPVLAEEIPSVANGLISEDGLNYTFNIRDGVTFHDGTDLDAEDVAYSVQRALRIHDPTGPSWMIEAIMTHYISFYIGATFQQWIDAEGVTEFWLLDALPADTGTVITEAHMSDVAEAVAVPDIDAGTVMFRLTTPYPAFIYICAYTLMSVVSMDYVEAHGGIVNGEANNHMEQNTCGTGPYKLEAWEIDNQIHMTRNHDYWGEAPAIADVYIVKENDVNTRMLMLQAGDADSIYLPIDYEDIFIGDDNYTIIKGLATFDMMFAGFNWDINTTAAAIYGSDVPADFFHDVHVRRAFTHLMDYDLFIENVLRNNGEQPNGAIPKGMFGYNESIPKYEYSLTQAQAEFELAINPDTSNSWWDDGFTIALIYNAGNTYRQTACELMEDTLETMGSQFQVEIHALDWPTYLDELRRAPSAFPMFWLGWTPDYADPDSYVTPFLDSLFGIFPYSTGYSNASIDSLIREAATELDKDTRYDLYSQVSMLVYEDAPYIWIYQGGNFHIERSWVDGYYYNPMFCGLIYSELSKPGAIPDTAPFADAGPDQTVTVGDTVTFDGSDSTDDGVIENYTWTFEYDDEPQSIYDVDPTFVFDIIGTYEVTLTVTDDDNETDTDRVEIEVEPPQAPSADAGINQVVNAGETVTFDGSGSSSDVVSYTWTFTYDGATETLTGESPTFTFEIPGNYTVTLTVENDYGLTDADTVAITVQEEDEDDERSFIESHGYLLGAVAVLVVIVLVALLSVKRGRGNEGVIDSEGDSSSKSGQAPPPA